MLTLRLGLHWFLCALLVFSRSSSSSLPFFFFAFGSCCLSSSFVVFLVIGLLRLRFDMDLSSLSLGSIVFPDLLLQFSLFFYKDLPAEPFFLADDFSTVFDFFLISLLQVSFGCAVFLALGWSLRR